MNKRKLLQLFNDDVVDKPTGENAEDTKNADVEPTKEAKYTDDDLDRIISEKFSKWEQKKAKEISEAQKLAEMTMQEKLEYQKNQLQEELDRLKAENNKSQMSKQARSILKEQDINVSDEIVSLLIGETAENTKANIENFATLFKTEVEKAVKEALKGNTPKSTSENKGITRTEIEAITDRAERQRLISENVELFK